MKKLKVFLLLLMAMFLVNVVNVKALDIEPEGARYTITFDTNGGTSVASQRVLRYDKVTKPANPTKSICGEFTGWYTDSGLTNKYDFNREVTSSFTLYAGWGQCTGERPVPTSDPVEPVGSIYTITFDSNGGTSVASQRVLKGNQVERPSNPTKSNCGEFMGWYTDSGLTNKYDFNREVTSSFTLYAGWGQCTGERPVPTSDPVEPVGSIYTITFDSNGGTSVASQRVLKGNMVSKPSNPTKSNCGLFTGWYTDSSLKNKYDFSTQVTSSFTLYAGWGECTGNIDVPSPTMDPTYPVGTIYTITFDSNGGSSVESQRLLRGNQVAKPKDPTHSKCAKFMGWYTDSNLNNKYDFDKPVSSSFTLYAGWGECTGNIDVYYTVSFNSNGGSKVESQKIFMGGYASRPTDPVRDKYIFDGWYSDKSLTKPFNFQLTTIRSYITLYAKWNALGYNPSVFTVTFNSNGGSSIPSQKVLENNYVVRPNNPVKNGYEFEGWYTDQSLTNRFNFQTRLINSNITLYAKWVIAGQMPVYKVDFSYTSNETIYSQKVSSGDFVSKPTDPTRAGYEFEGWYKDSNYTEPYNFDNDTVDADTTIYAKWNQKSLLAEIFTLENVILLIPVVFIFGIGIYTVVCMINKKKI